MSATELQLMKVIARTIGELAEGENNPEKIIKLNTILFCLERLAGTSSEKRVNLEA